MNDGTEQRIVMLDHEPTPEEHAKATRDAIEAILAQKPITLIVMFETEGKVGVRTIGGLVSLMALYDKGADIFFNLLQQYHQSQGRNG